MNLSNKHKTSQEPQHNSVTMPSYILGSGAYSYTFATFQEQNYSMLQFLDGVVHIRSAS